MLDDKNSLKGDPLALTARENVQMCDDIVRKMTIPGIKTQQAITMGANLSDIYFASKEYIRILDNLLAVDENDHEKLGDIIIDIRTELNHINYHSKHVTKTLENVADKLYKNG